MRTVIPKENLSGELEGVQYEGFLGAAMKQDAGLLKDWVRWVAIFMLVALGIAAITGIDMSQRDRSPFLFFIGWWLSVALFVVFPGALLGGIVALAARRAKPALIVLIVVNSVAAIAIIYGSVV